MIPDGAQVHNPHLVLICSKLYLKIG